MRALLTAIAVLITTAGTSTMVSCQEETDLFSASVCGAPISTSSTNLWNYSIANTSVSDAYKIFCVMLEVDENTEIISAPLPHGWVADLELPHIVTWICNGEDLAAGNVLKDFSIEFSATPQLQNWSAMFNNIDNPSECPSVGGVVLAASSVPEPSGLAILIAGFASSVALLKKKRA